MKKIFLAFAALGLMMAFSSKEAIQREWEQSAHNNGVMGAKTFKMTLTDGTVLYSQLGDIKDEKGQAVFSTKDPVVRAAWNYLLIQNDGSKGIHNPTYVRQVLLATLKALQ